MERRPEEGRRTGGRLNLSYTNPISNKGVNYPIERDVDVITIMASISGSNPGVNMVYPLIWPPSRWHPQRVDPRRFRDDQCNRRGGDDHFRRIRFLDQDHRG